MTKYMSHVGWDWTYAAGFNHIETRLFDTLDEAQAWAEKMKPDGDEPYRRVFAGHLDEFGEFDEDADGKSWWYDEDEGRWYE